METTVKNQTRFRLSHKSQVLLFDMICYLFILLFVYTAGSKLATLSTFISVLKHYPLIGNYNSFVAYAVPVVELAISTLLIIPSTKYLGLVITFMMMTVFLAYIIFMFASGTGLPCSCGGIISKLSWQQHIWFNSISIVLAGVGIWTSKE